MKKNFTTLCLLFAITLSGFGQLGESHFLYPGVTEINRVYNAQFTENPPVIDGEITDEAWNLVSWGMAQTYTGLLSDWDGATPVSPEGEFAGESDLKFEYKILYDDSTYYMLLKFTDDLNIYSDKHAAYPGVGAQYGLWWDTVNYTSARQYWNQVLRPSVGGGDGTAYDAWRMDQIQFFLTKNNPAFLEAYTRNNDGVFTAFFPGAINSTNDTAVLAAQKGSNFGYDLTVAGKQVDNSYYIEFKDTTWTGIFPGDPTFVALPGDTLLINMEINDADGTTNRGDYKMNLSTVEGNGHSNTVDWVQVILVPPPVSVMDIIADSEDHTTLETAVLAAGLDIELEGPGPYTVFAPTDDAFAALPEGTLEALLADPFGSLTSVLAYHVVPAAAMSGDLADGMTITTLKGTDVTVTIEGDKVYINDAEVILADIEADNGVVHVINAVLTDATRVDNQEIHKNFTIYPNPNTDGVLHFNKTSDITIYDISGRIVLAARNASSIDIRELNDGVYFVKNEVNSVIKLIKK